MNVPSNLPEALALLNACLNATSGVLIVMAFLAIRRQDIQRHRKLMLTAVSTSAVFLVSYAMRMAIAGDRHFTGEGTIRPIFFAILITHVLLAMAVLPMILRAIYLATKGRIPEHKRMVKWAYPTWLYVSITGVIVYLMLYQYPA